jgi:hypothetical protein
MACPVDSISLGGGAVRTSEAAQFDTLSWTGGKFTASWDHAAGTVSFHARFNGVPTAESTYVTFRDDFDVSGVAMGTVVPVIAHLAFVTGHYPNGTQYDCSIRHGSDLQRAFSGVWVEPPGGFVITYGGTLDLPLTIVAGQPERIEVKALGFLTTSYSSGNLESKAQATLSFVGLPPGAQVTSCKGFGAIATPSRPTTWGRLKAAYR